jgi:hypothetical protein
MENSTLIVLLSPILITVGGIISWFLKSRKESLQLAEQLSREKRLETYKIILEPYWTILSPQAKKEEKEKAMKEILTIAYKRACFDLVTFGSDKTVRSFNKFIQYKPQKEADLNILNLFSNFTLNVRKDLYKNSSKLDPKETLKFIIKDLGN